MPVTGPVPWERAEHTAAKHDIYRRYLHRWFPIILSDDSWNSATYVEGFAGPGVYSKGEEGSPIIALRAYVSEVSNPRKTANFLFIDDDPRCVSLLGKQLTQAFPERPRAESDMPVVVKRGKCQDLLEGELDNLGAWGAPIIAVLDSWGNAPIPYKALKRIADNKGSEVIITFEPQHFVRFVTEMGEAADDVFGGDRQWRKAGKIDSAQKRQFILTCYRTALRDSGFSYLLDFELVDRRGNPLYLLFATNHRRGVEKMKDSLWEVDRAFGVGFRDPRDEQLEALFEFEDPQLAPLTRLMKARLDSIRQARVEELRDYALFNTVFRPEHVIKSLRPLLDSGAIELLDGSRNIRRASLVRATK